MNNLCVVNNEDSMNDSESLYVDDKMCDRKLLYSYDRWIIKIYCVYAWWDFTPINP